MILWRNAGFAYRSRSASTPILVAVVALVALIAACSHNGSTTGSSGTTTSGSSGTSSASGGGGMQGFGGGTPTQTLTVSPPTATITIASKTTPATQGFTALLNGSPVTGQLAWSLDDYAEGTISPAGGYTTTGLVGGPVKVTVTYQNQTASAMLTVKVDISEDVSQGPTDPGVSAIDKTALQGSPMPDPGASATPPNPTKILYPYADKTVMPRGLVAPLLQFSPGNLPPVDALVSLSATYFTWNGFIHLQNGATPNSTHSAGRMGRRAPPQPGAQLTINVTKAAAGVASGPATTSSLVAPASLKGAVYYQTYDDTRDGLYSVQPGVKQAATLIKPGCVVRHSVSANGTHLRARNPTDPTVQAQSGIGLVGADGSRDADHAQSPPEPRR